MANPFKHSNNPVREHIKMAEAGAEGADPATGQHQHMDEVAFLFSFF